MVTTLRLGKKPTIILDELRHRAANFIWLEELKYFSNKVRFETPHAKKRIPRGRVSSEVLNR